MKVILKIYGLLLANFIAQNKPKEKPKESAIEKTNDTIEKESYIRKTHDIIHKYYYEQFEDISKKSKYYLESDLNNMFLNKTSESYLYTSNYNPWNLETFEANNRDFESETKNNTYFFSKLSHSLLFLFRGKIGFINLLPNNLSHNDNILAQSLCWIRYGILYKLKLVNIVTRDKLQYTIKNLLFNYLFYTRNIINNNFRKWGDNINTYKNLLKNKEYKSMVMIPIILTLEEKKIIINRSLKLLDEIYDLLLVFCGYEVYLNNNLSSNNERINYHYNFFEIIKLRMVKWDVPNTYYESGPNLDIKETLKFSYNKLHLYSKIIDNLLSMMDPKSSNHKLLKYILFNWDLKLLEELLLELNLMIYILKNQIKKHL